MNSGVPRLQMQRNLLIIWQPCQGLVSWQVTNTENQWLHWHVASSLELKLENHDMSHDAHSASQCLSTWSWLSLSLFVTVGHCCLGLGQELIGSSLRLKVWTPVCISIQPMILKFLPSIWVQAWFTVSESDSLLRLICPTLSCSLPCSDFGFE